MCMHVSVLVSRRCVVRVVVVCCLFAFFAHARERSRSRSVYSSSTLRKQVMDCTHFSAEPLQRHLFESIGAAISGAPRAPHDAKAAAAAALL